MKVFELVLNPNRNRGGGKLFWLVKKKRTTEKKEGQQEFALWSISRNCRLKQKEQQ